MTAQDGQFSRVTSIRVLPDRGSYAVWGAQFSTATLQKWASTRSPRNPVPSWHITNGRAGWREGS
jgi:hypothetical protein